ATVQIDHTVGGLHLVVDAAEDGVEQHCQAQREHDGEDEQRAVAQLLPQVLGGDQGEGAHPGHSRSALPVRCRNTDSRSGSRTSTDRTAIPAVAAADSSEGSRLAAWSTTRCRRFCSTRTWPTWPSRSRACAAAAGSPST